jgi:hypothetical protein
MSLNSSLNTARPDQEYYLHLGLHKTATTALQEFFHINSANLLSHDVRYIPLKRMRSDITPLLVTAKKDKRNKLFKLLEKFPNRRILLSDENIIGCSEDILSGTLYPFAENRVQTFCEEAGERPITLFITLREPAAFLTSMYCEYIRQNEFIAFEKFIASLNLEEFSYAHTFKWIKDLPKNTRVHVTPFEKTVGGGIPVIMNRIITEVAGANSRVDIKMFPERISRSSFSREEIELASDIARRAGAKMAQVFLNALEGRALRFGHQKFSPIELDIENKLNNRYLKELEDFFSNP